MKAGADAIVLDGMQGGTAATQDVFIEHVGIPTLPAVRLAVEALQELDMHRKVRLIVSRRHPERRGRRRRRSRSAPTRSRSGPSALIRDGRQRAGRQEEYEQIRSAAGFYDDWQAGLDPGGHLDAGGQARGARRPGARRPADRELPSRPDARDADAGASVRQSRVRNLEPEDLVALTIEAAAMAKVPLAGTDWIPGTQPQPT